MVAIAYQTNSRVVCRREWSPSALRGGPGSWSTLRWPLQGFKVEILGWPGVVTVVLRYAVLICGSVEVAARRTQIVWSDHPLAAYLPQPEPTPSLHLSDGRDTVSRRAALPDNMWKGVGLAGKGYWDFAQFCVCRGEDVSRRRLLRAACYQ